MVLYFCTCNQTRTLNNEHVITDSQTVMLIKKNKETLLTCNVAGFGHTEGYLVLDQLKPGDKLTMMREDENKFDHNAIALFYKELHIGYIPQQHNNLFATMMDFGYADIFECIITSIDTREHPNNQIHIRVNLLRKSNAAI